MNEMNVSTKHVSYLLQKHGKVADPARIEEAETAYARLHAQFTPMVFGPDELSNAQAALAFPSASPDNPGMLRTMVLENPRQGRQPLIRTGHLAGIENAVPDRTHLATQLDTAFSHRTSDTGEQVDARFLERVGMDFALSAYHSDMALILEDYVRLKTMNVADAADGPLWRDNLHGESPVGHSDSFGNAFNAIELRIERGRVQRALNAFCQHLDPETLRIARATADPRVALYNALAGHGDPEKARYRQQAFNAYPLFANKLEDSEALDCIDAGAPPPRIIAWRLLEPNEDLDAIANAIPDDFTEHEAAVRRLHGVTWQKAGRYAYDYPDEFVDAIRKIPANWIPSTKREFQAFITVMGTVNMIRDYTGFSASELLKGTRGDWADLAERLSEEPGLGVRDMLDRAIQNLVTPAWVRLVDQSGDGDIRKSNCGRSEELRYRMARSLFGKKNLPKILKANARFHRNLPRLKAVMTSTDHALEWPALSAPTQVQGNLWIVPLTTQGELTTDGNAMDHCVGGYADTCLSDSHIVSIRADDGTRLATAQLCEEQKSEETYLEVFQIEGPSNTDPGKDVRKAVNRYVHWLNEPENKPDFSAIEDERERIRHEQENNKLINAIGFNPDDLTTQEAVWQEWRNLIIGPDRKNETYSAYLQNAGWADYLNEKLQRALDENEIRRILQHNRSVSHSLRMKLQSQPTIPSNEQLAEGILRFDEYAGLNFRLKSGDGFFVEPGNTILIRHIDAYWRDIATSDDEARLRAEKIAKMMWDQAQHLSELPTRLRKAAEPQTTIIAHSHAEARAYRETARALLQAFEPQNAPDDSQEHLFAPTYQQATTMQR